MNAAARLLNQGSLSRTWVANIVFHRLQFSLIILVLAVIVSALSMVYVTNATRSLKAGIQQILTERDRLHVQWGQLLLEKTTWIMQAHVQEVAQQKLGMFVPDHKSVVVVSE